MSRNKIFETLFHRHKWREIERFYSEPPPIKSIKNSSPEMAKKLLFGVTTILYSCECGAINKKEIIGKSIKE
jgi:hypothetical protein